jgi:hypothetical protein
MLYGQPVIWFGTAPVLLYWLSKKRSGIQRFLSTTTYAAIPQFRNSEHYYEKRCKGQGLSEP